VAIWRLYFKALQLVGGALLPAWREIYHGLPQLIEETRWLRELQEALAENRFSGFSVEHLTAYGSAIVVARK
jgi:demethylmenaquinone methyltransferase/2-methoxy-6-polyprenyl-1,4-benzoquinol methylase